MDGQLMYDKDANPDEAAKALHMGAVEMLKLKRNLRRSTQNVEKIEHCMRIFVRNTPRVQFTRMGPALEKLAELYKARAAAYSAHDMLSQILDDLDIPQADDEAVYADVPNLADDDEDRFR